MVVSAVLWGVIFIIIFLPSTETRLIPVSPYFESSEETVFSKAALKVSPVDLIVGTPYNPQVVEEGILPDIEHWICSPSLVIVCCLFVGHVKGYSKELHTILRFKMIRSEPAVVPEFSGYIIRITVPPLILFNLTRVWPKSKDFIERIKRTKIIILFIFFIFNIKWLMITYYLL